MSKGFRMVRKFSAIFCCFVWVSVVQVNQTIGSQGGGDSVRAERWMEATTSSSITEKPVTQLPVSELVFRDEHSEVKTLSDLLSKGRPALLAMVYFNCASACTVILNGAIRALNAINLQAGNDYDVVVVSVLPSEGPELAAKKKASYMKMVDHPETEGDGWHFLTGTAENVIRLAYLVGFSFVMDPRNGELIHDAGVFFLSPEGKLTRTLFGAQFKPEDIKQALLEAGGGRVGSLSDRVTAYFKRYDHYKRTYRTDWGRAGAANGLLLLGVLSPIAWRARARVRRSRQ